MLDKRSRNILILFGLVLLVLIITEATRPKAIDWRPSYTDSDTAPFGSKVFYEELPSLLEDATFETIDKDPFEFLQDTTAYRTNTAYFFINDYVYFDEEQRKKLQNYVAAGNTVFISSSTNYWKVNDSVRLETRRKYNELEEELHPDLFTKSYQPDTLTTFKKGMYKTTFFELDTLNTTALGYYKSEDPDIEALNFVKLKHGDGEFYFHTVPSCSTGFCVAKTKNGGVILYLFPSIVIWRSSITSKRAACVFAGALLISSIRTILENIGPCLNSNSLVFTLKTEVPKISLGIKSGVNWMRLKSTAIVLANSFAVTVFATPGTPSINEWPSLKIETMSISSMFSCPTITLPSSAFIFLTASCNSSRSIRDENLSEDASGFSLFIGVF